MLTVTVKIPIMITMAMTTVMMIMITVMATTLVTTTDDDTHHTPPESVRIAGEVRTFSIVCVLLGQVDEVGREDESQEADVQRSYQLLKRPSQRQSTLSLQSLPQLSP